MLLTVAVWLSIAPQARATPLAGSLLQHTLLAGLNAGAPSPQRTASSPVGTLPGSFVVDDRGAARYSIPLDLPPAARGLEPALSLEYDSQLGDGPLGVGWALGGGNSAITRCGHTLAEDGELAPVRMTSDDALCLDGQRLMLVDGAPFEIGATYRPKRDDFSRVRVVAQVDADGSNTCHGGYGFEVRRRDGTIATYGCRRDATVTTHLGARTWSLAQLRGRFGNAVNYHYRYETTPVLGPNAQIIGEADVEHYLSTIDYGAHLGLHTSTRHVRLDWETRPDPSQGYSLGAPQRQSSRLARVTSFAANGLAYRYQLTYANPSITGRSLLQAVQQCDAKQVCKPATRFEWEPGEHGFEPTPGEVNFAERAFFPFMLFPNNEQYVVDPFAELMTLLDANGDGRTDMFLSAGDGTSNLPEHRGWETWTSQPGAHGQDFEYCGSTRPNFQQCAADGHYLVYESERSGLLALGSHASNGPAVPPMFATDHDGDGRDDVYALGDNVPIPGLPPAGRSFFIARSLPEGGVDQFEFDPGAGLIWLFSGADQTGDGLGDLLFCAGDADLEEPELGTGRWLFAPNVPGVGFNANAVYDTGLVCSSYDKLLHLDHDGDGLASLLVIPAWDAAQHKRIPSKEWSDYAALELDPHADWAGSLAPTGLPPDLAQRWRASLAGHYNNSDIDDDFPRSNQGFGVDRVLDLNDDGLQDILRYELHGGDGPDQLELIYDTIVVDDPPLPEWGGVRIWLNTGAGFVDGGWLMQSEVEGNRSFARYLASGVLDYDGDGVLDYLTPVDDPDASDWAWTVWISNGDGSFDELPVSLDLMLSDIYTSPRASTAFDLTGDGLHDVGVFTSLRWSLRERVGEVPDKLVRIENGLGAWIDVSYRSITDYDAPSPIYALDLDSCAYPRRCERDPRIVVDAHRLDSGGQLVPRRFEHRYGMARSDREGRRGLGFVSHETIEYDEDHQPIYRRRVGYSHTYAPELRDFPYTGIPATITEDQRDAQTGQHLVTHIKRIFDYVETEPGYHPYVSQQIARSYELETCADTFCEVDELDEDQRISDVVDTIFELDDYANPTLWTTSIDAGDKTLTYRHEQGHINDGDSWLLGLPIFERTYFVELGQTTREREWIASYDPDTGALQTHTLEPTRPELFLHTTRSYDAHGNLVSQTATDFAGEQRSSTVSYDDEGVFPVQGVDALGHSSELRWDPGLGVVIEARDPNGLRKVADYDGLGHVTGLRSFAGQVPRGDDTTFSYQMLGPNFNNAVLEIRQETAGHGYDVAHYDRLGRVIKTRSPGHDGVARDVTTRYDRLGRVTHVSLPTIYGLPPDGHDRYEYDFADRLIRHRLPDDVSESWLHHGLELVHIDTGGMIEVTRRDLAGRVVQSVRALGTPDEEQLCFDYGGWELTTHVRPDCVGRAALSVDQGEAPPTIKRFVHDDLGRLISSHDPSEGLRSYFYNGHGELARYVDGNDNEVALERDALGRVIMRSDVDGLTTWSFDQDFIGELDASLSPDGHEQLLAYDDFGRLETLTKVIAGESFELGFAYDDVDRLAEIHYPHSDLLPSFWVRNAYTNHGQLREVRSGPTDALLWRVDDVDALDRVTVEQFGNGTTTQRSYDPLRPFTQTIETNSELGGALQSLAYTWNHDGTLERREDLLHAQHEAFEYDFLHRVAAVHTGNGQQSHDRHFAYDSLGNLVFATDRGEYEYDSNGRLAVADASGHEWDGNGNLLARTGARAITLSYTAFDKPAELETQAGASSFEYDADQERVYRYSEADARESVYVTELYQRHRDTLGGETQHHYYVPGLERIVATVVDTDDGLTATRATHYLHTDHLGSTDVVSDELGVVEQRMSFDVWGKRRDAEDWSLPDELAELGAVNLGYTGHEAQEDGGLLNMGGRMYDPQLGRMASADPFVVAPNSAQGWNRYAYVLNQPLSLTDPTGFEPTGAPPEAGGDPQSGSGDPPRGASGMVGVSQTNQAPTSGNRTTHGGTSEPRANQGAGEQGPGAPGKPPRVDGLPSGPTVSGLIAGYMLDGLKALNPGTGVSKPHTLEGFTDAMLPHEGPSQERRRLNVSAETADRVSQTMQDPPTYVVISIEMTLFFIGGDAEAVGALIEGGVEIVARRGGKEALPLVAGVLKKKKKNAATSTAGGKVYRVPGEKTPSGKPYIGRTKQKNPGKRGRRDGRDRRGADVIDSYDPSDTVAGRRAEQNAINREGGVNDLDNKRNEIRPSKWSENDILPP
ncbi:putative deoxyribonuclease RhsC [Enhygromyxa salina]|uniref:Putative deoxyribonuclease RhsC n=2 Tax=Enhygromyxa salina TaxID=215803 RepID=A0A2S9YYF0_9BACT|nr:putative deoxyribonuclease RhsC [Enhygromyxa salina]